MPLSQLERWPRNPKKHSEDMIVESVNRFGFVQPILMDENSKRLVAGHGRLDTLLRLKREGKTPPERIHEKDGEWLVPVLRGIGFNSRKEAEAYLIADNQTTILGGWDETKLFEVLKDHVNDLSGIGFTQQDYDRLSKTLQEPPERAPTEFPEDLPHDLIKGDFRDNRIPDESIDLVLTDPPYGKAYLDLWKALGQEARRVLKPGGWLITYMGKGTLDFVLDALSRSLSYYWILCLTENTGGTHIVRGINIMSGWKAILCYYKPPLWARQPERKVQPRIVDILHSPGIEKDVHEWQQTQAPFEKLLDLFSLERDTVWEPMAGGGTTIRACIAKRRGWIAHEKDPRTYQALQKQFRPRHLHEEDRKSTKT